MLTTWRVSWMLPSATATIRQPKVLRDMDTATIMVWRRKILRMRKKMIVMMETGPGGRGYGAYYVLLPLLRPLGSDWMCLWNIFLVCFDFFFLFLKKKENFLDCSLNYNNKRKERRDIHWRTNNIMYARVCEKNSRSYGISSYFMHFR